MCSKSSAYRYMSISSMVDHLYTFYIKIKTYTYMQEFSNKIVEAVKHIHYQCTAVASLFVYIEMYHSQ